jgi:regulator of replication initiation timing
MFDFDSKYSNHTIEESKRLRAESRRLRELIQEIRLEHAELRKRVCLNREQIQAEHTIKTKTKSRFY